MSGAVTDLPSAPLRIAALQAEATPADVAHNARTAAEMVRAAAQQGARVAVLPELHLCAYDLAALAAEPARCEVTADDAGHVADSRLRPLAEAAVSTGALILIGAAVRRADGLLANSVLAVEPSGQVTSVYDKQHLWHADEAKLFAVGHGPTTVEADGWRLGLAVCYDMSFPEHARAAALSGAHVYLCLSAFASGNEHRAAIYMAARALENTVYTVFVNPVGGPAARPANGGSRIYAPDGTHISEDTSNAPQTLLADLNPRHVAEVRSFLRMLAEQRSSHSAAHA